MRQFFLGSFIAIFISSMSAIRLFTAGDGRLLFLDESGFADLCLL
jgi:hypothetical protein